MKSLSQRASRAAINAKCTDCTYDPSAAGTRLQQITLCSVVNCALYPCRPKTKFPIADSVLTFYGIDPKGAEAESILTPPTTPKDPRERANGLHEYPGKGKAVVR